jgi:uncharacterized protein YjbI with pentapeptide repeats
MDSSNLFTTHDMFEDQLFSDQDLKAIDLSDKDFVRCTFRTLLLQESRWQRTRLEDCVFDGCDLTRMQPKQLALRGVELIGCRLIGVDWTDIAANPTVAFDGCNLQYASFVNVNLTATRIVRCRAIEVSFLEARLADADFTGSDLSGSTFDQCDLRKADFRGTQGLFIDPAKNRLKGARIDIATAVLLATSFGLRVSGFDEETEE